MNSLIGILLVLKDFRILFIWKYNTSNNNNNEENMLIIKLTVVVNFTDTNQIFFY